MFTAYVLITIVTALILRVFEPLPPGTRLGEQAIRCCFWNKQFDAVFSYSSGWSDKNIWIGSGLHGFLCKRMFREMYIMFFDRHFALHAVLA